MIFVCPNVRFEGRGPIFGLQGLGRGKCLGARQWPVVSTIVKPQGVLAPMVKILVAYPNFGGPGGGEVS